MPKAGDERVLVTGAARGIGRACAVAFQAQGARVAWADFDHEGAARAVAATGQSANRARAYGVDVRDPAAVRRMVVEVDDWLGGIDVLVTSAGVYPSRRALEMSVEEWDDVMQVNARGTFLTAQAVARAMVARGRPGAIVTIASGSARFAREGAAHYGASKAAVVALTRALALELAPVGIRVNAVSPGLIDVPGGPYLHPEYKRAMTAMVPAGRMGTPEDVAAAVTWVASVPAAYVTGQVIVVDGGLSAGRYGIPSSGDEREGKPA